MARTIKYSKEDILEKSVDFIKEHGYSKLTARELAKYIGCSTGPIFKNYENFDMYKEDLKFYLRKDYSSFIYKYVDIKDIKILLTPTNRLCDVSEKYREGSSFIWILVSKKRGKYRKTY